MANISTYFDLKVKQKDLDFIDVKLNDDNLLFIDPRLIEKTPNNVISPMADCLYKFFVNLMIAISNSNAKTTNQLLSGVSEPSETRLGYGHNNSNGRSAGPEIKKNFVNSIKNNPVIKSRQIQNFSDVSFFVPNMGPDRVSDITTKIIKNYLILFTQKQCKKLSIPVKSILQEDILNDSDLTWSNKNVELPIFDDNKKDRPIIFVPKNIVNTQSNSNSNLGCFFRFARNYIIQQNDNSLLKGIPRNGKDNSFRTKDVDASIESVKDELSKWVVKHPNILNDFWGVSVDRIKPLSDQEISAIVY